MKSGIEQIFVEKMKEENISPDLLWASFKKGPDGLVVAVAQDYATRDVLMLAYMDEEAFRKTLESGLMHYHSRSRGKLWLKGETSGHLQRVVEARMDCDLDTLLFLVDQTGAACHTGETSCFYRKLEDLKKE
jgi:phosphoribosyl-AMP cyclohydrolase